MIHQRRFGDDGSVRRPVAHHDLRNLELLSSAMRRGSVKFAVAVATSVVLATTGCSGGGASHQSDAQGEGDAFAANLKQNYGITADSDAAADIASTACQGPTSGVDFFNREQALQKRYPNINMQIAMSAGVLAYCPGR